MHQRWLSLMMMLSFAVGDVIPLASAQEGAYPAEHGRSQDKALLRKGSGDVPVNATSAQQKPVPGRAGAQDIRTVEIIATDDMKFSPTTIPAKRGERLRVRLISKGTMPKVAMAHNFVLLQKGTNVVTFITAAAQARATDFIPPDMKESVIATTSLAGAGETVDVTFTAPKAPGSYPYVCSFPGHFQAAMRGALVVE